MPQRRTVILSRGGLRSLVATASHLTAADPRRVAVLYIDDDRAGNDRRMAVARRQAEHFKIPRFVELPLSLPPLPAPGQPQGETAEPLFMRSWVLLLALAHAVASRCERLVWPAQFDGNHEQITRATEQAMLTQHLAQLDVADLPEITMPLLDLTDRELVDVGNQLNVPWELAWSCDRDGSHACGVCHGCQRRHQAFQAAGVADPAVK